MSAKINIDRKAKTVTITLPLMEIPRTSSTGATCNIAEARNEFTGIQWDNGKELKVTAQVYFKPPQPMAG